MGFNGGMSQIIVRPAQPAEYRQAGQITVAAYRDSGQLEDDPEYIQTLADAASRARDAELLVAVDEENNHVVGTVTFCLPGSRYAEISRPGEGEFRMLAVHPDFQRRGIGELLVRAVLARAAELNLSAVVLCTRDILIRPQRLYTRLGFTRIPERDWTPVPHIKLLAWRIEL